MTDTTSQLLKVARETADKLPMGDPIPTLMIKLCDAVEQLEGERESERGKLEDVYLTRMAVQSELIARMGKANAKLSASENRACDLANSLAVQCKQMREALEEIGNYPGKGLRLDSRSIGGLDLLSMRNRARAALKPVDTGGET